MWGLCFTQADVKPLCSSSKTCLSRHHGVFSQFFSLLLFPRSWWKDPPNIPHSPCWNQTFRAQDLEHSHAQKEWSTNAEVGHVSKHLRFLETTTSKAHSPHHGEIKARWRSGLSFKYFWVYEGGGRWEAEFWNGTHRRPNLPRPKGDSKQVCTTAGPAVDKTVISWSHPCQRISTTSLAQFILFQSNQTY